MNVKAEAFQEYNQAAVLDKLITGLPEVVRALSEPLSKVDKVTIVSTGNGDAAGAYKLTGDITKIAATGARALRSALRHADVGPAEQSPPDRRQGAQGHAAGSQIVTSFRRSVPQGALRRSFHRARGDSNGGKSHESDDAAETGTVLGAGHTHHGYAHQRCLGADPHRVDTLFLVVLKFVWWPVFRPARACSSGLQARGFHGAGNVLAHGKASPLKGVSYKALGSVIWKGASSWDSWNASAL